MKSLTASPSLCHEGMGVDATIFVFCMSFKAAFSLSHLHQEALQLLFKSAIILHVSPPSLCTSHPLRSSQEPGSVLRVLRCSFSPALCSTPDGVYMSVLLLSVLVRRMNLKPITQREVSQKEKSTNRTLAHVCGIWKNGADEPICREGMETQTQKMEAWTQGEKERV